MSILDDIGALEHRWSVSFFEQRDCVSIFQFISQLKTFLVTENPNYTVACELKTW